MSGCLRNILLPGVLVVLCLTGNVLSAAPNISSLTPAALAPGKTTSLTLNGDSLDGMVDLWTSFACDVVLPEEPGSRILQISLPKEPRAGVGALRLITTNGLSAFRLLLIDAMPAVESSATNHSPASAQALPRNTAIDGACEELRSDYFRLHARKGERIRIEAVAQRLGSPLDPLLRLLDAGGREIAFNDDTAGLEADAQLDVRCPATGDYLVELRDSRHGGGSNHRYRLRFGDPLPVPLPFLSTAAATKLTGTLDRLPVIHEAEPNADDGRAQFVPLPAELHGSFGRPGDRDVFEFTVRKGQSLVFTGRTRSLGSPCDLYLQLQSTNGTKIAEANATGADEGAITNRFTTDGTCRLAVEELTGASGPSMSYRLTVGELKPGFALSTETDRISGPPGRAFEIEVKAARRDYDGPIELKVEGLPSAFAVTNHLIPAKTNTTTLQISAPAGARSGEAFAFSIVGSAKIDAGPVNERVSTLPALRAAFPRLRHLPHALDGLMQLGISESPSTNPKPQPKKRKK